MATARIEFTLGSITFSGEGEENWLSTQLDKIIEKAPDLINIVPAIQDTGQTRAAIVEQGQILSDAAIASQTLPNFLKSKGATGKALHKFLATAIWLHGKGLSRISTSDITKALKDSNQSRLVNPSDCLNKNVSKGLIEKDGKQFFVTDEGKASI
ncbi:MAG TPA: hypothetical protein G4N93_05505 [Dehalococcoidia bacterium]|nr:hypothetical protein [Dehalococcoidia bacterium]